jgi:hypothetical protein
LLTSLEKSRNKQAQYEFTSRGCTLAFVGLANGWGSGHRDRISEDGGPHCGLGASLYGFAEPIVKLSGFFETSGSK